MKRFNFLITEEQEKQLKEKAKKENRTASDFLRNVIETPNLAIGDWWSDTTKIRRLAKELKKELKEK